MSSVESESKINNNNNNTNNDHANESNFEITTSIKETNVIKPLLKYTVLKLLVGCEIQQIRHHSLTSVECKRNRHGEGVVESEGICQGCNFKFNLPFFINSNKNGINVVISDKEELRLVISRIPNISKNKYDGKLNDYKTSIMAEELSKDIYSNEIQKFMINREGVILTQTSTDIHAAIANICECLEFMSSQRMIADEYKFVPKSKESFKTWNVVFELDIELKADVFNRILPGELERLMALIKANHMWNVSFAFNQKEGRDQEFAFDDSDDVINPSRRIFTFSNKLDDKKMLILHVPSRREVRNAFIENNENSESIFCNLIGTGYKTTDEIASDSESIQNLIKALCWIQNFIINHPLEIRLDKLHIKKRKRNNIQTTKETTDATITNTKVDETSTNINNNNNSLDRQKIIDDEESSSPPPKKKVRFSGEFMTSVMEADINQITSSSKEKPLTNRQICLAQIRKEKEIKKKLVRALEDIDEREKFIEWKRAGWNMSAETLRNNIIIC